MVGGSGEKALTCLSRCERASEFGPGMKGTIGTSARAGWRPAWMKPAHEREPPMITYGCQAEVGLKCGGVW